MFLGTKANWENINIFSFHKIKIPGIVFLNSKFRNLGWLN